MIKTASNLNNLTFWSAPECWDYKVTKGIASDVFSFGVILWELLTKQVPWINYREIHLLGEMYSKGKTLDIPSHVPKKFQEILTHCWQFGTYIHNNQV